jgi:hypothetical protein
MPKLEFTCPDCKGHTLEEIQDNVTVATEISGINNDGSLQYGEATNENGEVIFYQCADCGEVIHKDGDPITSEEDLLEWLETHQPTPLPAGVVPGVPLDPNVTPVLLTLQYECRGPTRTSDGEWQLVSPPVKTTYAFNTELEKQAFLNALTTFALLSGTNPDTTISFKII